MHDAYQLSPWHYRYTTLVGSAVLAGLKFIAVSIQIRRIAQSPIYRARAWGSTSLIVALVADAGVVLAPRTSRRSATNRASVRSRSSPSRR